MKTRISEHKRDLREHRLSNAMVIHAEKFNHLPRWEGAVVIEKTRGKNHRRAIEAAHILLNDTVNARAGFYTLARGAAKLGLLK